MNGKKWTALAAAALMLLMPLEDGLYTWAQARAEEPEEPAAAQEDRQEESAEAPALPEAQDEEPAGQEEATGGQTTFEASSEEEEADGASEQENGPAAPLTDAPTVDQSTGSSVVKDTEPSASPDVMPSASPDVTPSASPDVTPSASPSAAPTTTPTAEPESDAPFEPQGEAWAKLSDGQLIDGSLQDVMDAILVSEQGARVYLMTEEDQEVTVSDIPKEILGSVAVYPDSDAFVPARDYEVVITVGERTQPDSLPDITFCVVKKKAPENGGMENSAPEDGTQPEGDAAPDEDALPEGENVPENSQPGQNEMTPGEAQPEGENPDGTSPDGEAAQPEPPKEPTPGEAVPGDPETDPEIKPSGMLTVEVEGYMPGVWSSLAPVFTLSGIPENSKDYVYGVFICDEQLMLLSEGNNVYVPEDEGEVKLRFTILDMMGDVMALSPQYDMMLDFTPPDGPYLSQSDDADTVCVVDTWDALSGIEAISFDGGTTWEDPSQWEYISFMGEKGDEVEPGTIQVRDVAGNISANAEEFTFGRRRRTGLGGGTGGKKPVHHVKETLDYSKANYNALDLVFEDGPQTELKAGDTVLSLKLMQGTDEAAMPFTAQMTSWFPHADMILTAPNALMLTAQPNETQEASTWRFTGDVYKLLYNSGVDYMVLRTGDYITAIPTAGFTGGTQYGKLKASGVSTRKFDYTISQDEALRETAMTVAVEEEIYLLTEDQGQPMYRYDVLIGTDDLMRKPYESYFPENR